MSREDREQVCRFGWAGDRHADVSAYGASSHSDYEQLDSETGVR